MKIHEYQAAALFNSYQIPVPKGKMAEDLSAAIGHARDIGYPVVLKAQVLVGGRGKAGGVKFVQDASQCHKAFEDLQKLTIKEYPVKKIYIVKAVKIIKEYYLAVIVDGANNDVVIVASEAGGVDIEETAKTNPGAIKKYYLQGRLDVHPDTWDPFVAEIFPEESLQRQATDICRKLLKVFFENDCSLAEINPLIIDDQEALIAADAKVVFDDNALSRHPQIEDLRDKTYDDPDELEAKEKNLSFVKLEGNVGCIVN
ncbi:MAG: acetate--CoA ligase family protein, partial [Candidatus Omnitrophica bacterium]|nr:acetate--CoA ligase family protein [Candidatus Omnitrophota bacterium]